MAAGGTLLNKTTLVKPALEKISHMCVLEDGGEGLAVTIQGQSWLFIREKTKQRSKIT